MDDFTQARVLCRVLRVEPAVAACTGWWHVAGHLCVSGGTAQLGGGSLCGLPSKPVAAMAAPTS